MSRKGESRETFAWNLSERTRQAWRRRVAARRGVRSIDLMRQLDKDNPIHGFYRSERPSAIWYIAFKGKVYKTKSRRGDPIGLEHSGQSMTDVKASAVK